jgi:murein DD-endopeptidase MepM/ murein hydrolase activator NlpD
MIGHPGGLETVYGHLLPKRRVTVGQLVKRGALIALMGNTGHSTGVHLHIEVIRGDRRIDPLAFLPR